MKEFSFFFRIIFIARGRNCALEEFWFTRFLLSSSSIFDFATNWLLMSLSSQSVYHTGMNLYMVCIKYYIEHQESLCSVPQHRNTWRLKLWHFSQYFKILPYEMNHKGITMRTMWVSKWIWYGIAFRGGQKSIHFKALRLWVQCCEQTVGINWNRSSSLVRLVKETIFNFLP